MARRRTGPGGGRPARGRVVLIKEDLDTCVQRLRALVDTVEALRRSHDAVEIEAGTRAEMYVPRVFRPL